MRNPNRHKLLAKNTEKRRGLCDICGAVDIVLVSRRIWRCRTARRLQRGAGWTTLHELLMRDSCEICGATARLFSDHDHSTGKHRGTLCSDCNAGIGLLGDTLVRLEKAVAYFKSRV